MSLMKRLMEEMEPEPGHDGRLDERSSGDCRHASVWLRPDYTAMDGSWLVAICGRYGDYGTNHVNFDPKQALLLLEWLKQNQSKLEQLAQS